MLIAVAKQFSNRSQNHFQGTNIQYNFILILIISLQLCLLHQTLNVHKLGVGLDLKCFWSLVVVLIWS